MEIFILKSIHKLLIIRLSSLGDILLTTPLIRSIKKEYPGISIDYLVRKEYKECVEYNPNLSKVLYYTNNKPELELLADCVKKAGYGLSIDLQNNLRSQRITKAAGSPVVHFSKRSIDKFLLVNFKINRLKDAVSIPERYAAAAPGLRLDDEGLEIFGPGNRLFTEASRKDVIGFCPGSRHFTKMWPKEYYIELGKKLSSDGKTIHLIGGKSDIEICSEISSEIPGSVNLSNNNDLYKTASELKKCSAVICNDSGLMHLACAVKTPVLVFFGSTVREFGFAPYKNKNLILENNSLSCRPCSHIGRDKCPKKHFKCMKEITPSLVCEKLGLLLSI